MAHINADPVPLALLAPSAPPSLVVACEQALAKDPAARPRSAAAFAHLVTVPGPAKAGAGVTRTLDAAAPLGPGAPVTRTLGAAAPLGPGATVTRPLQLWGPIREGSPPGRSGRPAVHTPRTRARRRGLLVALVVAGAALAALPALAGGLLSWPGGRIEEPFAVQVPGLTGPRTQAPDQAPAGRNVAADPAPAEVADAPADDQPARADNDDRDRDDAGGSSGPG